MPPLRSLTPTLRAQVLRTDFIEQPSEQWVGSHHVARVLVGTGSSTGVLLLAAGGLARASSLAEKRSWVLGVANTYSRQGLGQVVVYVGEVLPRRHVCAVGRRVARSTQLVLARRWREEMCWPGARANGDRHASMTGDDGHLCQPKDMRVKLLEYPFRTSGP